MSDELIAGLHDAVYEGDPVKAAALATQAVTQGVDPLAAFEHGLTLGITEVGEAFGRYEMFLPDLVLAAEAMKAAAAVLDAEIRRRGVTRKSAGVVVLGTVAGDLHDIGKTITGTLLAAHGFEVVDLGVDVSTARFVDAVKRHAPGIVGMSSLLTVTAVEQRRVIEALEEAGLRAQVRVLVGGGAITEEYARSIGADGYGQNADQGVRLAKQLVA